MAVKQGVCKQCGSTFGFTRDDGRPQEYCSSKCRSRFHYLQKRKLKSGSQICESCKKPFHGPSYKLTCSDECLVERRKAIRRKTPVGSGPTNKKPLGESPLFSELADEQPLNLEEIRKLPSRSLQKLNWVCRKDPSHVWSASVSSRTVGGNCLICKGNVVVAGFNDLATLVPEALEFWDYERNELKPSEIGPFSRKTFHWKCPKGHTWVGRPNSRSNLRGCGFCANQRIDSTNSLATLAPEIAAEWDLEKGLRSPDNVGPRSGYRAWWICPLGHSYSARVIDRVDGTSNCHVCSGHQFLPGFNDLQTRFPEIAKDWSPRNKKSPTQVGHGTKAKAWWLCPNCDSEYFSAILSRTANGTECPNCSKGGFDTTSEGYLYLLTKEQMGLQQFGITNVPNSRLANHKRNGWEVLDVVGPADGLWVLNTETSLGHFFKAKGLLLGPDHEDKFEGYSESWWCDELSFSTVAEMLEALRAWEQ